MATYLLLRDNKETGPYTFEEIRTKGLKAYDLVWVEGRSAAWRYPGEVEELKPFSPEVVEQPFDRFFKRPAEPAKLVEQPVKPAIITESIPAVTSRQAVIQTGNRNIYVTLPAGAKRAEVRNKEVYPQPPGPEQLQSKEQTKPEFARHTTPIVPVQAELLISSEREFESQARPKAVAYSSASRPRSLATPLMAALTMIVVLAAGIFIGTRLNSNNAASKEIQPIINNDKHQVSRPLNTESRVVPVSEPIIDQAMLSQPQNNAVQNTPTDGNVSEIKKGLIATEKKKRIVPKEQIAAPKPTASGAFATIDSDAAGTNLAAGHREAIHRGDAVADDKDVTKTALLSMVSVASNKYSVGTFGGISELQLTVNNKSQHTLDLVVVEVQYVQANKKIFKTENLYFKNISANSALMQEAPKSPRGVKVQYKVTLINSKDSNVSYSGL